MVFMLFNIYYVYFYLCYIILNESYNFCKGNNFFIYICFFVFIMKVNRDKGLDSSEIENGA